MNLSKEIELKPMDCVRVKIGEDVYSMTAKSDGTLHINGLDLSKSMTLEPVASNVINLKLKKW